MFNCADCKKPIGPRVSPIVAVMSTRNKQYRNLVPDSRDEIVSTSGWEITREARLCRECAKMEPLTTPEIPDVQAAIGSAEARHEHARRCKRPLDECKVCKDNIRWFNSLPKTVLSDVLLDRKKKAA